jgi:lipopolysaccharide/colanic/teichoic acid biosynthesis glycosyltransferase
VGAFLRRTSLDELPQLWNVLRGNMSLVGPRPVTEDELTRYGDKIDFFLEAKPGITGLWQVSGRNDVSYEERVRLDAWYARNWQLWFDLVILMKTVNVVFSGRSAY